MAERASREQVDKAFMHEDTNDAAFLLTDRRVLAAEVRALRETLARIEALAASWQHEGEHTMARVASCADDLEKALKGES